MARREQLIEALKQLAMGRASASETAADLILTDVDHLDEHDAAFPKEPNQKDPTQGSD